MVESDLEVEKAQNTGATYIQSGNRGSGLHREPSFSRWCGENGGVHCSDSGVEDPDFELPMLQDSQLESGSFGRDTNQYNKFQMRSIHLSGSSSVEVSPTSVDARHACDKFGLVSRGSSVDNSTHHDGRHGHDKYAPFDIENRSTLEISYSNVDADHSSSSTSDPDIPPPNSKSLISVADVLKTLFFILVWYTFSTFLTLYNKTLLGDDLGKFPAPLLMNTVHFSMQAILSKGITWYWSYRFQPTVTMSWKDYFLRVVPTALGTALDINLSNASLVFISVTFATMCKSASPIFLLLFAFAFRLESPSFKLLGIILIISVGILLTVAKETEFEFWGFIFVTLAAVMSGFRWSMTQILLQKESYGLKNPLTLMSYVTPVMAVSTALLSLILDPWYEFKTNNYFNNSWNVARSCLLMLFGGMLAFFMVLTEYILVSVTSAVTVTIAGVVKEAVTILVAVFYFHDEFTWLKGAGLATIMFGVSLFNWFKYQKLQDGQTSENLVGSPTKNVPVKYVILEEMDDQDGRT